MDEDGTGNRSPPRARSPDARLLPPSRFAAEAAAASGGQPPAAGAPVTPATTKTLSVSFVSPLAAAAGDSLPASFDSLALQDSPSPDGDAMSLAAPSSMAASAFAGPASFAPSAGISSAGGSATSGRRAGRKCSRRKLAIGSRLLKLTTQVGRVLAWGVNGIRAVQLGVGLALWSGLQVCAAASRRAHPTAAHAHRRSRSPPRPPFAPPQNYPPLVEARAAGAPSMSALAVFRDLSEDQWEAFMASVRGQVARKLRDGAWKQAAAAKGAPMMSCPRF